MANRENFEKLVGGEIYTWVSDEKTTMFLKSVTPEGDPVELTADEARELAEILVRFAAIVDE